MERINLSPWQASHLQESPEVQETYRRLLETFSKVDEILIQINSRLEDLENAN